MSAKTHPLHATIGKIFKNALPEGYKLIKDEASGGSQRIPLFASTEKSRETWYRDVDLLVLKDEKIRIIVEIEESSLGPTQACARAPWLGPRTSRRRLGGCRPSRIEQARTRPPPHR